MLSGVLKTHAGTRQILLGEKSLNELRDQQQRIEEDKLKAGTNWRENDLIFPSNIGAPFSKSHLQKDFAKTLRDANLPRIRFHDLRHTAATLMLQEGVHPKIVQERLGHADINLTLNTYSHVLPDLQLEAAEKLDRLLE